MENSALHNSVTTNNKVYGFADIRRKPIVSIIGHFHKHDGIIVQFMGYVANRSQLWREFGECCDEKLIALAYKKWGRKFQNNIYGEYCAAISNTQTGELILVTDSLGLRPIYYIEKGGVITFSSSIELISKKDTGYLNKSYIAEFILKSVSHSFDTIYKGVRQLEPGFCLIWRDGKISRCRIWSLQDIKPIHYKNNDEYNDHFLSLLQEGISGASQGVTWCELSGGLDSSSIASVASGVLSEKPTALSFVYSESHTADEKKWMRSVIDLYELDWETLDEDLHLPLSELPDRFLPHPMMVGIKWPRFREFERVVRKNNVDVILSGYGGDQVLGGDVVYPAHLADHLRRGQINRVRKELTSWQREGFHQRAMRHLVFEYAARPLARFFLGRSLVNFQKLHRLPEWLGPELVEETKKLGKHMPGAVPRLCTVGNQYFYEPLWRISLSGSQMWNQISRGYDIRHPLLYRPLVEFMAAIPPQLRFNAKGDRVLQRRALQGILPTAIVERKDKQGPDEAFYAGLAKNQHMVNHLLSNSRIAELGYVDPKRFGEAIKALRFGAPEARHALVSALCLEIWLRQLN